MSLAKMPGRTRAGKSLILLVVVGAVLAATVGVGTGVLMGRRAAGTKAAHAADEQKKKEHGIEPATIFSLGEMVVNLADTESLRYAKINVALGLKEKIAEEKLKESSPVLRDVVI